MNARTITPVAARLVPPLDRGRTIGDVFRRSRTLLFGLVIVVGFTVLAVFAPVVAPTNPVRVQLLQRLQPPSTVHFFGTDEFGRDLFSRVLYGGRISLSVAIIAVAITATIGGLLGVTTGFFGGSYDLVVGRLLDVILGFPTLLLALGIVAIRGPSLSSAMFAIGLHGIPSFARVSRAAVLSERTRDYVESARSQGASAWRIMVLHILPNALGPILVALTLRFALAILDEAALSFLGLGAQPPTPTWGGILRDSQRYLDSAPWYSLVPGGVIFLTVMGFNVIGDSLRDLLDPRLRQKR